MHLTDPSFFGMTKVGAAILSGSLLQNTDFFDKAFHLGFYCSVCTWHRGTL